MLGTQEPAITATNSGNGGGITVTPFEFPFGAELSGVDIARGIDERTLQRIRDAVLRHAVVAVRGQSLSPQQHVDFMNRLYGLRRTLNRVGAYSPPGFPNITVISNIVENGKLIGLNDAGQLWHTDTCFQPNPEVFVSLYALQIPVRDGVALGDTRWVNTAMAYDALPDAMKRELVGLKVTQNFGLLIEKMRAMGTLTRPGVTEERKAESPPITTPLVRTHPITGRKLLYVNESFTEHVEGMPAERGSALLKQLFAHIVEPRFMFRHSWRVGDLVLWDNASTQHVASFDYGNLPRRLHRCGTEGPVPQ